MLHLSMKRKKKDLEDSYRCTSILLVMEKLFEKCPNFSRVFFGKNNVALEEVTALNIASEQLPRSGKYQQKKETDLVLYWRTYPSPQIALILSWQNIVPACLH